jgi:hypothetical protein
LIRECASPLPRQRKLQRRLFQAPRVRFPERKAIVIFGYEHSPPLIDTTVAIESFEAVPGATAAHGLELPIGELASLDIRRPAGKSAKRIPSFFS